MSNGFTRAFKYCIAWFGVKVDGYADPEIQLKQVIHEATKHHLNIVSNAAEVKSAKLQVEFELARQNKHIAEYEDGITVALQKAKDSPEKAEMYEELAKRLAHDLVLTEKIADDYMLLGASSIAAEAQAMAAVRESSNNLQELKGRATRLESQMRQVKLQELIATTSNSMAGQNSFGKGVTFDAIEAKIEARYALALGTAELASTSVNSALKAIEAATVDSQAEDRIDRIRANRKMLKS